HRIAVNVVLVMLIGVYGPGPDSPAVLTVEAFLPPAVRHAEIEHAVETGLLAAGTACLQGHAGIVEPHVDTLDKPARQCHVVVFEQHYLAPEAFLPGNIVDVLYEVPGRLVCRMGLPGKDDLDRGIFLAEQFPYPLDIPENQRRPLVSGEPSCKTYRKRSGIDARARFHRPVGHAA